MAAPPAAQPARPPPQVEVPLWMDQRRPSLRATLRLPGHPPAVVQLPPGADPPADGGVEGTPTACAVDPQAKYSYESLDYVDVENELLREDRAEQLESDAKRGACGRARWLLLFLVGVLTGATAFGIERGIDFITDKKWAWVGQQMENSPPDTVAFWPAYGTLEGPMIHAGAVIGGGITTGKSSRMHCDTGLFKDYRSDRDKRMFVAAGSAAGVAAAFGAPVGGVLFAVEEAVSWWTAAMGTQIFVCATVSAAAVNLGLTNFGAVTAPWTLGELPLFFLLGALGGVVGALFVTLNIRLTRLRKRVIRGVRWRRVAEALVVNWAVSTTLFVLCSRLYQCEDMGQLPDGVEAIDARHWGCSNETTGLPSTTRYNDLATYFFTQTEDTVRHLFHSPARFAYSSLSAHFFPYFFLTVLTYGIGVPSGLFLPSLALGATMGRFFAQGVMDVTGITGLHLGAPRGGDRVHTVWCGRGGGVAGVIRMTVSLSVIVMESSGNVTYIVPLMIITCTAKFVGDLLSDHGIYDAHIHFSRVPLIEGNLCDPRLAALTATPTAEEVLTALSLHEDHHGFVVTGDGTPSQPVQGVILR
eukprot:gene26866-58471_t